MIDVNLTQTIKSFQRIHAERFTVKTKPVSEMCVTPAVLDREVFPVDPVAALHKGAGGFVIDRGQRANVADELVQQGGLDQVRLL